MGEVVGIGAAQAKAPGNPEVKFMDEPRKMLPVTITGTLPSGKTISDKMEIAIPQKENDYVQVAAFVWNQYRQAGTISFREPGGNHFVFYPLTAFEKIDVEFSTVVGITL